MCGIAGILNWPSRDEGQLPRLLQQMSDSLAHRGPDDAGQWVEHESGIGFAHRRLSIIDLSAQGRQPFVDTDGRYVLVLNGEIYNYLELRDELSARGAVFRTATDTEVLLEALKCWGRDALDRLDGMFAFAFHDVAARRTLLARDRFGEKPLYWGTVGEAFVFGSELVAISALPGFDSRVDSDAVAEYLFLQYFDSPHALHHGARKLAPGSWMVVERGRVQATGRYFTFRPREDKVAWNADALADELEDILVRSLRRRLLADVPTGAFLSGGVDSALVAALIRKKLGRPLHTYTLGFSGTPLSEHTAASATAAHLGCDHHEQLLAPDALAGFSTVARALDEPNADTSCLPVYHLAAFARTGITVALSGDGADEMFGGYSRYGRMLSGTWGAPHGDPGEVYYRHHLQVWSEPQFLPALFDQPDGFYQHRDALFAEVDSGALSLCDRLRMADVNHYMPGSVLAKVDRMTMSHALEVRTPFLNPEVAAFAERLPAEALVDDVGGKVLVRHLAKRYLPAEWVDRSKMGFSLPNDPRWAAAMEAEVRRTFADRGNTPEWLDVTAALQAAAPGNLFQLWSLAILQSYASQHPTPPYLRRDRLGDWELARHLERRRAVVRVTGHEGEGPWNRFIDAGTPQDGTVGAHRERPDADVTVVHASPESDPAGRAGARGAHWVRTPAGYVDRRRTGAEPPEGRSVAPPLLYDRESDVFLPSTRGEVWAQLVRLAAPNSKDLARILGNPSDGLWRPDTPARAWRLAVELTAAFRQRGIWLSRGAARRSSREHFGLLRSLVREDDPSVVADGLRRVVFVIHDLASAGAERQLVLHAIAARAAGFDTAVLVLEPLKGATAHFLRHLRDAGIPVSSSAYAHPAADPDIMRRAVTGQRGLFIEGLSGVHRVALWNLLTHLSVRPPSFIHCFVDLSCILGGLAAVLMQRSHVVFSFRNKNPTHFAATASWMLPYHRELIASRRIVLTGNSTAGNDDYAEWLGVPPTAITLVRNALLDGEWAPADAAARKDARRTLQIDEGAACLVGAFQLEHYKRPLVFLDVIARLRGRVGRPLVVLVAGVGQLSAAFEQAIRRLHLDDVVRPLGRVSDMRPVLAAADVLLLTSGHGEGTPNVLLEAQAAGVPVVTTDAGGGAREAVADGESGFVLGNDDLDGLADACARVLADPALRDHMAGRAVAFVREHHAMRVLRDRLTTIYNDPEAYSCPRLQSSFRT